ncbi:MAG: ABC transporter substrate-binding protein [Acidimicrobiales bacterium]
MRRHPGSATLEAWFDGEPVGDVAGHVASCSRCFTRVEQLSLIRAAVRTDAGFGFAPAAVDHADDPVPVLAGSFAPVRSRPRTGVLVGLPAVVLLVAGALVGVQSVRGHVHGTLSSSSRGQQQAASGGRATDAAGTHSTNGTAAAASSHSGTSASGAAAAGHSGTTPGAGTLAGPLAGTVLRLGIVVPTVGSEAGVGAQMLSAAQAAVNDVNGSGGVDGALVQLTSASAEDPAAVAAMEGAVDALVGGSGVDAPGTVPWIVPADPWQGGASVVSAELSPLAAGQWLGRALAARGLSGTVGIVQGTGPDTAMATGIASVVPSVVQSAPSDTSCLSALSTLEAEGVSAVAVAGDATLAASCLSGMGALSWTPASGILVPPSSAYSGLPTATMPVYTVLGFPWPSSGSVAVSQFRQAVPGTTSYQALVTYAAVELAAQVARSDAGHLTMKVLSGGTWRGALYDYSGTVNAGEQLVTLSPQGWVPAAG